MNKKDAKKATRLLIISIFINILLLPFFILFLVYFKTPYFDWIVVDKSLPRLCEYLKINPTTRGSLFVENNCNKMLYVWKGPRDKIINYTVTQGDNLDLIANKFNISTNTILWENDLNNTELKPGQVLRILPVSGVSYLVVKGDTLESVADKFKTTKQKIIDYPFNDYSDPIIFTLIPGKVIIVPDGVK